MHADGQWLFGVFPTEFAPSPHWIFVFPCNLSTNQAWLPSFWRTIWGWFPELDQNQSFFFNYSFCNSQPVQPLFGRLGWGRLRTTQTQSNWGIQTGCLWTQTDSLPTAPHACLADIYSAWHILFCWRVCGFSKWTLIPLWFHFLNFLISKVRSLSSVIHGWNQVQWGLYLRT